MLERKHEKKANNKSKRALTKRRKTAIALSLASSAILASIGFEVILNHKDTSPAQRAPKEAPFRSSLPLVALEDSYSPSPVNDDFNGEDLTYIEFLSRENKVKSQKVKTLTEELTETKARLKQLKTDILVRGGEKERLYKGKIIDLEDQLEKADGQIRQLQAELAARNRLIETKRGELESLSTTFNETNNALRTELKELEGLLKKEQAISQTLTEENKALQSDIEEKIQAIVKEQGYRQQQEEALAEAKDSLKEQQREVSDLLGKLKDLENENKTLHDKMHTVVATKGSREETSSDIATLQNHIEDLNQKLEIALNEHQTLNTKIADLETEAAKYKNLYNNTLTKKENPSQTQHRNALAALDKQLSLADNEASSQYSQDMRRQRHRYDQRRPLVEQQEKLIMDLERSLAGAENQIKALQNRLKQQVPAAPQPVQIQPADDKVVADLQERLDAAELHAFELEQTLKNRDRSTEDQLQKELEDYKVALNDAKETIKNLNRDYAALKDFQMGDKTAEMVELQNRNALLEQLLDNSKEEAQELRLAQKDLEEKVYLLEEQLVSAEPQTLPAPSGGNVADEEFYRDRITLLEEALEVQKETLLAAQQELLRIEDERESFDQNYQEMEAYFNVKIQELIQSNKALEEELAAAEEHIRQQSNLVVEASHQESEDVQHIKEELADAWLKYDQEHQRSQELEQQLELAIKRAEVSEEELAALEQKKNAEPAPSGAAQEDAVERLKSQISYLTSRLTQARSKLKNSEERLREMNVTQREILQRNRTLEAKLKAEGAGAGRTRKGMFLG